MLEELKELEQEAMDNLEPETYDAIISNVLCQEDQEVYQAGYIDGLQTAIKLASENNSDHSYTIEIDEMFGEEYDNYNEDTN